MNNPMPDPTLEQVCRTFPGWQCWTGVSGLFYARLHADQDVMVQGESTVDLCDEIRRAESKRATS